MIIFKSTISRFNKLCKSANHDLLISEIKQNMKNKIGRGVSDSEERSWRVTLVKLSKYFKEVKNSSKQYILLEFKIPFSQKRIDIILLGSSGKKQNLMIIELKGWSESFVTDLPSQVKINSKYVYANHPAIEAEEYKFLLTQQFSDINKKFNSIEAVALLPNYIKSNTDALYDKKFDDVMSKIALYHKNNVSDLIKNINTKFNSPTKKILVDYLDKLEYKPTKLFKEILKTHHDDIKLFGSQKTVYEIIINTIDKYYENKDKVLITISGAAGSGKTVIALKVLSYIFTNKKLTAKLQLPGPEFRESVKKTFVKNIFNNMISGSYSKSEQDIIILDEAHKQRGHGSAKQFYNELFNNQKFIIALIDDNQVINKKGYTKKQILNKAEVAGFKTVELLLKEQFRNNGDATYISWLENWIFDKENNQKIHVNGNGKMHFEVLDETTFTNLYKDLYEKENTRIVSFWTQPWNAELDQKGMPKRKIKIGSEYYCWNVNEYWIKALQKFCNLKPSSEFKQKLIKKNFNSDKKGWQYVGYFNTLQGAEFNNIFVHLPKLFFLNEQNKLDVNLEELDFTDMKTQVWMKNKKPNPEKVTENKRYFLNRLIVNLTRGTKRCFVYCEDKKLDKWLRAKVME